ncbi:Coenzyme F420 hydrogenase/dehydrogenase, beta subunit C-terminal domain [Qipengyuania flava]|uniref:Coenzyme F420 hydrogenase/dehydrogenase, beta subunit C-terminal domain n=1 Tax=Qipengyuania flava TaxID=192812 RepID=UPI001C639856|nr:Coenzyme F420 hydrogenase/dehydrogenase, beta subunit C-terminal domain [Qipengyuania flava]QYJ06363.1 Coenzyme F420 hydrogenase/dehydrogenase, beta subunit C-terminal domain [Qipengyuania flava]
MNSLPSAPQNNLCIGCGYCARFDGVEMEKKPSGFLEPAAAPGAYSASDLGLIEKACSGVVGTSVAVASDSPAEDGLIKDHMWGQFYECLTGHSTDAAIRRHGSSGGVVSGIAAWLVETGEVDGVIVTGYDPAFPIGTKSFIAKDAAEGAGSGGSKYSPASPLAALAEISDKPGSYAVVGKPCDIATLRRAQAAGDPVALKATVLLSFYCAGTPGDRGNREVLDYLGAGEAESIREFRHRGNGWPGDTRAVTESGEEKTCTYNESWGKILRRHTHNLCTICPDGIGEQADIVAADAWYGDDDGYPQFEEADGRSLIMTRTPRGRDLLARAVAEGKFATEELPVREIDRMQPGQLKRRKELAMRVMAFRMFGKATPKYNSQALRQYQRGMSGKDKVKILFGTIRRIVRVMIRRS